MNQNGKQKTKKSGVRTRQKNGNPTNLRNQGRGQTTLVVPKQLTAMPDRFRTNLKFWRSKAINLSSSLVRADRYQPSGAYPDPLDSGTPYNQFGQFAAFYSSYRILSSKIKVELVNTSPDSVVQLTVLPTNLDPGATPTSGYILDMRLQSYAKSRMASAVGGPVTVINHKMSTERIYGNPMVRYDDKFASTIANNPENMWFWVISLYTLALIPSTTPILLNIFIDSEIEFYDRRFVLDSSLSYETRLEDKTLPDPASSRVEKLIPELDHPCSCARNRRTL
jgi:hypothetical protein